MTTALLNMRQVMHIVGIKSRQTVYARLRSDRSFPRPRRVNGRFLVWHRREVERYVASLPQAEFAAPQ